jgi:Zn-dependent M16 (insulinase) family peptidase
MPSTKQKKRYDMFKRFAFFALVSTLISGTVVARADENMKKLKQNQKIADFMVENIYLNETGQPMGTRFRHIPSGFVLDLLRIQSIPQAFIWVNSFPPSDQGEPHTCEHLLLGKGTKGRYVASLEDMSLTGSSAFTMQLQTVYHFHTTAGIETFYDLFEAKLDALINPTFSDEEIRREVCNIGYSTDPVDSTLHLEEKGTVYSEMVTGFERPWSNMGRKLDLLLFGPDHPLSYSSGGYPPAIRTMTPDDMWAFIDKNYHLNNMGMIASVDDNVRLEEYLEHVSDILKRVEPDAAAGHDPARAEELIPPGKSAKEGTIELAEFPHQNPDEPGLLLYAWPPERELGAYEEYLLNLFLDNIAGGATSNLYKKFIDSETRIMDLGANSVFARFDTYPGHSVYIGFNNVKTSYLNNEMIDSIRTLILDELKMVFNFKDDSEELLEFNERAKNKVIQRRRNLRKFLNTPPGFGYRGTGARWYYHLKHLQKIDGFEKNLALVEELENAEKTLSQGKNIWDDFIDKWGLLKTRPYGVGSRPNSEISKTQEKELEKRLDDFTASLVSKYGIENEEEIKRRYKQEYDAKTAIIENEAAKIPMPGFIDNPPLTLDDNLNYRVDKLSAGGPLVISTFETMTNATAGLAFNMYAVPETLLVYVSALPTMMTDVGVIIDGKPIPYDKMIELIRKEILSLDVYYSVNNRSERVELVVRGSGSDRDESMRAMDWMSTLIFSPDWREENLPRIRDAVDLSLKDLRNTMKRAEEAWVHDPANAYLNQHNHLLLSANSFLTKIHSLHRLRWMLKEGSSGNIADEFSEFMSLVSGFATTSNRDGLTKLISGLTSSENQDIAQISETEKLKSGVRSLSPETGELVMSALDDLNMYLTDIPDNSLAEDWKYLCKQMSADLKISPDQALNEIRYLAGLIFKRDNVRGFLVSGNKDQDDYIDGLEDLVKRLNDSPADYHEYADEKVIVSRSIKRSGESSKPVYVGLINENTRLGVHINSSDCVSYFDTDREKLLKFLSARLYGGGGAHSMFMKTWGAGLAYSNGLRSNENTGKLTYYAERCPDLAQTMQFVVNELKNAPYDPSLADYAVAQAFNANRAGGRYEARGEAIAADLADDLKPEVVAKFRQSILDLRADEELYDKLHNIMFDTYGEVLPGLGPDGEDVPGAIYFIIGPEGQFQSYEKYIDGVEGDVTIQRLYPRDYWLIKRFKERLPQ